MRRAQACFWAPERASKASSQRHKLVGQTCMIHNQLDLAKLLLAPGPAQDRSRGLALLSVTAQRAGELGMQPIQQVAQQLGA
jgi:hypothetical protein